MAKPFCLLHQALHLFAPQLPVLQLLVLPSLAAPCFGSTKPMIKVSSACQPVSGLTVISKVDDAAV